MKQPRDFSLSGAIDLGARQAAVQRRQRAAEQAPASGGEPGAQSGLIIDVTDETFNTEVVARSRTVPVMLDLWADWCGPCKQLGPILEKLAVEANGGFVLAKVDVDANPAAECCAAGAEHPHGGGNRRRARWPTASSARMPEAQVREWLGQVMQVAEQLGLRPGGPATVGRRRGHGRRGQVPGYGRRTGRFRAGRDVR